jgi:hypothetical protein
MLHTIVEQIKKIEITEHQYRFLFLVFLLGIVIRLFVCEYTYIVNSDGVFYVHQAKALYSHNIESLYNCVLNYLSIYTILTAIVYPVTGDFLTAAIMVSCFFGCLTLIPIYFLSRRFFSLQISTLITLIFALMPVFVTRSADVLKGPVCWFFFAFGVLAFIQFVDQKRWQYLIISLICFFFSSWARIEAVAAFPSILLYLFVVTKHKKNVFIKCCVIVGFFLVIAISLEFIWGISLRDVNRMDDIMKKFTDPFYKYETLRKSLKKISHKDRYGLLDNFIINARHQIHFVAFGSLISNACEAFFYPFFLFFIAGFIQVRKKLKDDPRLWFFIILSALSVSIVFVHLIQCWMIEYRYFALIILSSSIFAGFGIHTIQRVLSNYFNINHEQAIVIICLFILIFGLGKNLQSREKDKYIYRLMGETIEQIEPGDQPVVVSSLIRSSVCEKVFFYANRSYEGLICPQQQINFQKLAGNDYDRLVNEFRNHNVHYFLWEKRWWPKEWYDFRTSYQPDDFIPIMRSQKDGDDHLILYKLNQD